MNAFRCTPDRSLDRVYLRTCAIYRLLKTKRIGKAEALEIQNRKWRKCRTHFFSPSQNYLTATIEIWNGGPLKDMLP